MAHGNRLTLLVQLDRLSSRVSIKRIIFIGAVVFLVGFILLPPILGITLNLGLIQQVFSDSQLVTRAQYAVLWSFAIATIISFLDLIAGLPLAWLIARHRSRWINILDSLADIPFVIPTVALGFSTLIFWSGSAESSGFLSLSLLSPGLILVMLLHFAFSFPVIVRVMVGALLSYNVVYETAARTLGARIFTAVRTVTLPILRPSLVAAFLLAFARSLSETGATVIVAGTFENGPVFINNAKSAGLMGPMILVSFVLIVSSVAVFALIKVLGRRLRIPLQKAWPETEGSLSSSTSIRARNALTIIFFAFFVLVPSLFITLPALGALTDGTLWRAIRGEGVWSGYWQAMILSYSIGVIATLINVATGLPMAIIIARKRVGKGGSALLEAMVNVPIVVPSVALGVSLGFFWSLFSFLPEFWILVFAHTTITYTYFVQAMSAAIESIPEEMEETARTLGGRPFNVFRRVVLPLAKYSVFSGAILTFTRSVDETGAASAVSVQLKTAPVLLVSWVRQTVPATPSDSALGVAFLILTSFAALLALRLVVYRRR